MSESVKIIENGLVITCDNYNHVGQFALLVKDDRIAEVNPSSQSLKARYPAAEVVDASEKVIFPGFIDPHYHGESFVLRNWTEGIPMSKWNKYPPVRKAITFVQKEATKDDLAPIYRTAYFGALKSGITTIAEFGLDTQDHGFLAAREALKRSDLRGFLGIHNGEQAERAREPSGSSLHYALVLPGEEDLTVYNLQTTLRLAGEFQWPIISHLGETRKGFETTRRNFHRSVVQVLEEYKVLFQPVHLTHLAVLEDADEAVLGRLHIPVILNPVSILSKHTEPPPLARLIAQGIPLALCSDWGVPDPFENMRCATVLARLCGAEPLEPLQLLAMHTMHAARALHLHNEIGSIEGGKKADLTFVDFSDLRLLLPIRQGNPNGLLHRILQDATSAHVSDVMINGEFFLRKRQVMTYAEEDLKKEYRECVSKIAEHAGIAQEEQIAEPSEAPVAAPIIPLHGPSGGKIDEPFEEGFRIVGTTGALRQQPVLKGEPEEKKPAREEEQSKNIRRTFGDEDF